MIDVENDLRIIGFRDILENGDEKRLWVESDILSDELSASEYFHLFNTMIYEYRNTKQITAIFISMWKNLDPWMCEKVKNNSFIFRQINSLDVQKMVNCYLRYGEYVCISKMLDYFNLWKIIDEESKKIIHDNIANIPSNRIMKDTMFLSMVIDNPYCFKPDVIVKQSLTLLSEDKLSFDDIYPLFERYFNDGIKFSYSIILEVMEADIPNESKKWFVHSFCNDPYVISFIPEKHYANEMNLKRRELVRRLVLAPVSCEEKVFLYFNSKLKKKVSLSDLFEMFIKYADCNVISYMRDYWISGCIKYVSDDGFVRIAPDSVSFTLLPAFDIHSVRINDVGDIFKPPEEKQKVVFKVKDYIPEKHLFFVHYVCTKDYFEEKYES